MVLVWILASTLLVTLLSLIGIFTLAIKKNILQRILLGLGGLAMIMPGWTTDLGGAAILALIVFWQLAQRRRLKIKAVA